MPKVVQHEEYRNHLLDSCFEIFVRLGYTASTMRVLARELGISTGTLYHYFATKEDLFTQLVARKEAVWLPAWPRLPDGSLEVTTARHLFTKVADRAIQIRKLELLRLEAERTLPDDARRKSTRQLHIDEIAGILDIQSESLQELIFSTLAGMVMTSHEVDRESFVRQGEMLDELLTSYKKARPQ